MARLAAGHPSIPIGRLGSVPLGWLPEHRLPELASSARLTLLRELHRGKNATLTVRDALTLIETVLG